MLTVEEMVAKAKEDGASDIHLVCGLPPKYRVNGKLENLLEDCLDVDDCINIAQYLSGAEYHVFEEVGEYDAAASFADNRCRIHIFKQQGIPSIALRLLRESIPELKGLGLPERAMEFPKLKKGIVLVTGETGSGKSTTLAAILDQINHTRSEHIVTLEDPVEYVYTPDLCIINQREVGKDTRSFATGLRASLREDPDVILIGEMRDQETIETAITAAETGHLVFGTLHTGSAPDAIDRMVQVFPEGMQAQIRVQLSMCLVAVLAQQLIPREDGGGRVLACELMMVNHAIRNNIRSGKTAAIAQSFETNKAGGSITMDQSLGELVKRGAISVNTAKMYSSMRKEEK